MDQRWDAAMTLALNMAGKSPCPDPNPRVGCVIVADERVIGQGWHRGAGTPHAEIEALRQAGDGARGATAVVTLEPCNHTGRTGPCTEALIAAGVKRVVIAQRDPNPQASGGVQRLQDAGVEVVTGICDNSGQAMEDLASTLRPVRETMGVAGGVLLERLGVGAFAPALLVLLAATLVVVHASATVKAVGSTLL